MTPQATEQDQSTLTSPPKTPAPRSQGPGHRCGRHHGCGDWL